MATASPRLLAERFGLSERNVRRRAAEERWPRASCAATASAWDDGPAHDPALDAFVTARKVEVNELLLHPTRSTLSKFAFRRATEAAASRPLEASGWLRLVDQLRRNARAVDEPEESVDPADVLRARYAEALLPA